MGISEFIKGYIKLVNDPVAQTELLELEEEFNTKSEKNIHAPGTLLRQFIEKARKIVKPCIRNKSAYEEMVWRHNLEVNLLPLREDLKKQNRDI